MYHEVHVRPCVFLSKSLLQCLFHGAGSAPEYEASGGAWSIPTAYVNEHHSLPCTLTPDTYGSPIPDHFFIPCHYSCCYSSFLHSRPSPWLFFTQISFPGSPLVLQFASQTLFLEESFQNSLHPRCVEFPSSVFTFRVYTSPGDLVIPCYCLFTWLSPL